MADRAGSSFKMRAREPEIGSAELTLAGERLTLRADCSVYWPAATTLFVADTHFGKAGVFRRNGLGVPQGTTDADLARLSRAIGATGATRLVVLGDFLHAPPAPNAPWLARFSEWRARHAGLEILVTRGNHDRNDELPAGFELAWHAGDYVLPPFVCRHEPARDSRGPILAGHLHPVARLTDAGERLRVPVFWRNNAGLVLPAFCSFAGGSAISPAPGDRLFAVNERDIAELALA